MSKIITKHFNLFLIALASATVSDPEEVARLKSHRAALQAVGMDNLEIGEAQIFLQEEKQMITRLLGLITLLAMLVLVAACGAAVTPPAEQAATSAIAATEAAVPTATEAAAPATVAATATEAAAATEEAAAEATEEATTEASGEATSEAITVVQNFWEAINQKNVDEAMTYIADDAILMGGQHEGKEEIRKALEDIVQRGDTFELSEFKDENGHVTYAVKVFNNGNVVYSGTDSVNIVENGQIVFDGGTADAARWLKQRSTPAEATGEATSEAMTVVQNFWEAMNQKNVDEAMTYIADDAILMGGQHEGKEKIQKALEAIAQRGDTFELSECKEDDGSVTCNVKVFNNGSEVYSGTGVDIVENGQIVFDGGTADAARWLKQRSAPAAGE